MTKYESTELTRSNRLLKILNRLFLTCVIGALLMVQPTQLLKDLGVIGITFKHPTIGTLSSFELLLLFVYVTDLEPDVFLSQRPRRVCDNVFEALV